MSARNRIDAVRRIAVVRANGIGDYCFAVPAFAALRAAYPEAEIVLLGKSWHADFLHGRPGPVNRAEPSNANTLDQFTMPSPIGHATAVHLPLTFSQ